MKHIRLTSLYVGGDVVRYQSALIPTRTTMAKQQVKKIKRLLPVRVRKGELSQSKFTCPFLKKNGKQCAVLQPYRHLTEHCRKMHNQEVSLKCEIDDCSWECHISLRCWTSHRSNIETHGALIFNGGPNIDGSCKVVPYVEEEGGARGTRRGAWQHCRRGDEEESVAASAARWRAWRRRGGDEGEGFAPIHLW